jgi:hypothetical protein
MRSDTSSGPGKPDRPDVLGGRPRPQGWNPDAAIRMGRDLNSRIEGLPLYLFAILPIIGAIGALAFGRAESALVQAAAAALVIGGAGMVRRGLRGERAFKARTVARAGLLPLKSIGAACLGAAAFLLAPFGAGHPLPAALLFGVAAAAGTLLTYGLDPRGRKAPAGIDGGMFRSALDAASGRIDELDRLRRTIASRTLSGRINGVVARARGIVAMIERQPDTFNRARKLLNVYLDETVAVTRKYASSGLNEHSDPALEAKFTHAIDAMEQVMNEQQQKLLAADTLDLDVQLDVLTKRLKSEGLT